MRVRVLTKCYGGGHLRKSLVNPKQKLVAPQRRLLPFQFSGCPKQSAGMWGQASGAPRSVLTKTILVTANSLRQYPLILGSGSSASAMRRW